MPRSKRIAALLIDCDNMPAASLDWILDQTAKESDVQVRLGFGDWDKGHLNSWHKACAERGVETFQATAHVRGKNATDIVLAINAMRLLYTENSIGVFYIVTNDSDFAHLALQLQSAGKTVVGIVKSGSEDKPFANSCGRVLTVPGKTNASTKPAGKRQVASAATPKPTAGNAAPQPARKLRGKNRPAAKPQASPAPKRGSGNVSTRPARKAGTQSEAGWVPAVIEIVRELSADGECPLLSQLGIAMKRHAPPIDHQELGFKRLTDMLKGEPEMFRFQGSGEKGTMRVCLSSEARRSR